LKRTVRQPAPALAEEASFGEVASIHLSSVANQSRFVLSQRAGDAAAIVWVIAAEEILARRLHSLQIRDSRLGFEVSDQYF